MSAGIARGLGVFDLGGGKTKEHEANYGKSSDHRMDDEMKGQGKKKNKNKNKNK